MFSPYYAWSGRRRPENHVAINVALYGPGARWAMTERGCAALRRDRESFQVGRSRLAWRDGALEIAIEETCAPIPIPLRGVVHLRPGRLQPRTFALDPEGRHAWRPIAPLGEVEVRFETPRLAWNGSAYLDANAGLEPLEKGFRRWTWSRRHENGQAQIHYDVVHRDDTQDAMALAIGPDGLATPCAAPPMRDLRRGFWGVAREARLGPQPVRLETWEDAPFYTRSRVRGDGGDLVCETLDLDRFALPLVQAMLPARMPRAA